MAYKGRLIMNERTLVRHLCASSPLRGTSGPSLGTFTR